MPHAGIIKVGYPVSNYQVILSHPITDAYRLFEQIS